MDAGYLILSGLITAVSFILLLVSIHSYRVFGNKKMLFVIGVFCFFFIKGLLLSIGGFYYSFQTIMTSYYVWGIDLVILTLLYASALKR
jgi:hypothetical protein